MSTIPNKWKIPLKQSFRFIKYGLSLQFEVSNWISKAESVTYTQKDRASEQLLFWILHLIYTAITKCWLILNLVEDCRKKILCTYTLTIFHWMLWMLKLQYPWRAWKIEMCPASLHIFIGVFKKCLQWGKLRKDFKEKFCGLPAMRVKWKNLSNCPMDKHHSTASVCVNCCPLYWNKLQGLSLFRQTQNADKCA